jgi:hypothetical protein
VSIPDPSYRGGTTQRTTQGSAVPAGLVHGEEQVQGGAVKADVVPPVKAAVVTEDTLEALCPSAPLGDAA